VRHGATPDGPCPPRSGCGTIRGWDGSRAAACCWSRRGPIRTWPPGGSDAMAAGAQCRPEVRPALAGRAARRPRAGAQAPTAAPPTSCCKPRIRHQWQRRRHLHSADQPATPLRTVGVNSIGRPRRLSEDQARRWPFSLRRRRSRQAHQRDPRRRCRGRGRMPVFESGLGRSEAVNALVRLGMAARRRPTLSHPCSRPPSSACWSMSRTSPLCSGDSVIVEVWRGSSTHTTAPGGPR
jgi:hypothetical protein